MAELIFYQKPVALNKDAHRNLRIAAQPVNFSFAAPTNSVILTGVEFVEAAKEYPIIFVRAGERITSAALLGLRDAENLFVRPDGSWDARYIPAFVRRYPFVLAASAGSDELTVCVDEAFAGFTTATDGNALFDDQGEPALLLQKAVNFLQEYQAQINRTEIFVNRLHESELLMDLSARADLADGKHYALQGLLGVDEKKLLAISKSKALELFRCGELSWVYAHLFSLSNMNRLADLLSRRTAG